MRSRADPEIGDPTRRSGRLRTGGRLDPIPFVEIVGFASSGRSDSPTASLALPPTPLLSSIRCNLCPVIRLKLSCNPEDLRSPQLSVVQQPQLEPDAGHARPSAAAMCAPFVSATARRPSPGVAAPHRAAGARAATSERSSSLTLTGPRCRASRCCRAPSSSSARRGATRHPFLSGRYRAK